MDKVITAAVAGEHLQAAVQAEAQETAEDKTILAETGQPMDPIVGAARMAQIIDREG